jgi:hypothetical protein
MTDFDKFGKMFTRELPLWSFQVQKDSRLGLITRKDLEIHLISRALKDQSYRSQLITDPKKLIENEIGSRLPENLVITVIEEAPNTFYLVLPCNPYEGLTEDNLKSTFGMTYEDVARWVLESSKHTSIDENSSIDLIAKAWKDSDFHDELLNRPLNVIEKELGEQFQDNIQIRVLAETSDLVYIVMPTTIDDLTGLDLWLDNDAVLDFNMNIALIASTCFVPVGQQCLTF